MATLELINLSKRYGKSVWGAKDVNLKVNDKEFIVFLGPSGCGKKLRSMATYDCL